MILLISITIFAYLLKSLYDNIFANIWVAIVNMSLLWSTMPKKIKKVIVTLATITIVFVLAVLEVNGHAADIILNVISVISICATFVEIKKN